MTSSFIPAEVRTLVIERASERCEYGFARYLPRCTIAYLLPYLSNPK
jgi:hypothetical protein